MSLHKIIDAAVPPQTLPPGFEGVAGYIGGPRAHRTWTLEEWHRFAHVRQFPYYVPDTAKGPEKQALEAVSLAARLGWDHTLRGAAQRVILLDMETAADRAWYARAAAAITAGGFVPVAYGSLSTVLGNAAADVIAAAWDDNIAIPAGQTVHGHQYAADVPRGSTVVDYTVVDDWLMARGGTGPRHGTAC